MKHFLTNYNIKSKEVEVAIKNNFPDGLDFCYTDPPWGSGNLRYWQTINKKMTGNDAILLNQDELENIVVKLIAENVKNYAFIVYGKREKNSIIEKFKKYPNIKKIVSYNKHYKSGSKLLENCVICITLNDAPIIDFSFLENLNGLKGLMAVCNIFKDKYKTCLDLFIGIGYYLNILNQYGFTVCGNELNAARLAKAKSKV